MAVDEQNVHEESAWWETIEAVDPSIRLLVHKMVGQLADDMSASFYEQMLADPRAARLLDHDLVSRRLHAQMVRWLRELFEPSQTADACFEAQQRTGEVHARIGVPADLVGRGARVLKRDLGRQLAKSSLQGEQLAGAIQYVFELIDLAVDAMNAAYSANASRMVRTDEAYRLFFLHQNMRAEREKQKSQLLEWAHQILARYYWDDPSPVETKTGFSHSQFGLWLHHKASMLFDQAPEIADIEQQILVIENDLLPRLASARSNHLDAKSVVVLINRHVEDIKSLLASMFDRFVESEDGHDTITRLLNRRFFPSVARREIALAQQTQGAFSLLLVDIDRFSRIRESMGSRASDLVLTQIADVLFDSVRAGDFVFRIGEDRFLVLLVEAPAASAWTVAEGLRQRVEAMTLRTTEPLATSVTVCVGVAPFDGHPDYQRLLDRAEQALSTARAGGWNRCALAETSTSEGA